MNATAYFIKGRAMSLVYEASRFPATAETALAWLHRAYAWALARDLNELMAYIAPCVVAVEFHMPKAA